MIFKRLPKPPSFERIRASMLAQWLLDSSGCAVVAFTSRLPREGVSTVVAGLARAFGGADPGGVLVLDVARGRRRVANLLKVSAKSSAMDAFAPADLDLSSVVTRDQSLGVDFLPLTDGHRVGPAQAERVPEILDRLRAAYRVILVDAGPLTNTGGAYWLATSNYRVLVIDLTNTTREILEHQRKQLEHGGIRLDGSILNKRTHPIPRGLYWLTR